MTTGTTTTADVLVSTDWVAQHLNDSSIRIVEVDVDTAAFDQGHVPNAIAWNWTTELCDTLGPLTCTAPISPTLHCLPSSPTTRTPTPGKGMPTVPAMRSPSVSK